MAFITTEQLAQTAAAKRLIAEKVPSRLGAQDATVFDFLDESVAERLGWANLTTAPPTNPAEVQAIADVARNEGLEAVILIGQGGSTQAAQTITKLHSLEFPSEVAFKTMDSLSPVYVNYILGASHPQRTLYIVSSKSGSTLEPTMLGKVAFAHAASMIGTEAAAQRFIAITDEGSELDQLARANGWRTVLPGPSNVGGRFSALSTFGLLPMACVGINAPEALAAAAPIEQMCARDSVKNPAVQLAAFLYTNYAAGRDKFALLTPTATQVFGLWVEQLVAESLGKGGVGILPNVEIDPGILSDPARDTCAILCNMNNNSAFEHARACLHPSIPVLRLDILDTEDMAQHFLIWEYAIAFVGYLMQVNPFDQPDVEEAKLRTRALLTSPAEAPVSQVLVSPALGAAGEAAGLDEALRLLFASVGEGDYFALNAFLPFRGTGRREALERIRHRVANRLHARSCLEIGPRYLHSTGQLHKGGANNGVFLVVSSAEPFDLKVPGENFTLGDIETAQALADFSALAARGRRAVYVHLENNDSKSLAQFADACCSAISAAYALKIQ